MEDRLPSLASIIAVLALVLANGVFVAAEFAIVRSHPTKLRNPDIKRKFGVQSSLRLVEDLDLSLSATQLGITVASLALGWWGEQTFAQIFSVWFAALAEPFATLMSHAVATACALIVITFLHVVLGELAAKSLAIRYPESTLRMLAPAMSLFTQICRPIIYFMTSCANLFLRLFGVTAPAESERVHSLGELAMLIAHSTERGLLDKEEEEMLQGIFGFSETVGREIMTPRTDLVVIPVSSNFDEVVNIVVRSGLSRFPVTGESVDQILGVLLARDLLALFHQHKVTGGKEFNIRRLMREPYFVPGTKPIDDLLSEFKRRKLHMAIVLDEHGGVDGVVTLEDILEEIVGDIFDESDVPEKDIVVEADGDVIVDGGVLVADINDRFEFGIPEGDYDTIAGFILTSLGRMPVSGDRVLINGSGEPLVNGPNTNGVEEALAAAEAAAEVAAGEEATPEEDQSRPKLLVTVEKVTGHRIEAVRLHPFPQDNIEPAREIAASQGKGYVSGTDV